jgi:hypothetical protein
MALWFCEIRAKELILQGTNRTSHMNNRFATRKNQMQQYVVDLDEAAYEQHMIYL